MRCAVYIRVSTDREEQKYKIFITEKYDATLLNELEELKDNIIDLKILTPEILNRFVERIVIKW